MESHIDLNHRAKKPSMAYVAIKQMPQTRAHDSQYPGSPDRSGRGQKPMTGSSKEKAFPPTKNRRKAGVHANAAADKTMIREATPLK
jgi:hypothetical protein